MAEKTSLQQEHNRILSIDFFRGFTMFMLVSGITGLFTEMISQNKGGPVIAAIGKQLDHAEWIGLYAWDLIQPFFMFIVGVAIPFSVAKRMARGESRNKILIHAVIRSVILFLLGFMLDADDTSYNLCNVLTQLSFTYLVAFLLMRTDFKLQLLVSFLMILISDLLYRFWPVEGFNQPFVRDHNFGSWVDIALTGSLGPEGWVSFNAVSTTAHTMWGVLAGQMLMRNLPHRKRILILLIPGITGILTGYLMGTYIPIIKHTCTSSFVIVSGGYCLVTLAFSYWLIDVMNFRKLGLFFAIVGMNPLLIYIFSHRGGKHMLTIMTRPFTYRIFSFGGEIVVSMVTITIVAAMMWYICYFLYKRKVFIRL